MDLRHLQYFLAAVEQRSLGRAAQVMNISQPAISKAIRRLELRLGVDLLERLPRGVAPTLYGEMLFERGTAIQRELERAETDLKSLKLGQTGKVVVGAGSSMRLRLLPDAILALIRAHPKVEIEVVGKLYDGLIPDLRRAEIDFAVCQLAGPEVADDLVEVPLYSDESRPTVRVGHPLLARPDVTAACCLEYGWVLPSKENLGRRQLEALLFSLGLPAPQPITENNSVSFAVSMLTQSDLVGWHPGQVINMHRERLAAIQVPDITLRRNVGIVMRKNSALSVAAKLLMEEIRRVSRLMVEEGVVDEPRPQAT